MSGAGEGGPEKGHLEFERLGILVLVLGRLVSDIYVSQCRGRHVKALAMSLKGGGGRVPIRPLNSL